MEAGAADPVGRAVRAAESSDDLRRLAAAGKPVEALRLGVRLLRYPRISLRRRLQLVALLPLGLILAGTVGYHRIEGWPLFDALYMAVITLTTIGYGETHPLSVAGRAFTIGLALGGIFTLFYATTEVLRTVVSGELAEVLGRRRMEKKITALENHVIVCGHGRMGRQVCQELVEAGVPVVVVDRAEERLAHLPVEGALPLVGDPSEDDVLRAAGLGRARALVVVMASDADNVFITMSARLLNERIPIVARAEEEGTVPKLQRAGATRVISPYVIGGGRMAQAVLRPAVLDFIEVATRSEHLDLQIEELGIPEGSALSGKTLVGSALRGEGGLIVVAIKHPSGHMVFNPAGEARLEAGDTLIVLGPRGELDRAARLLRAGTTS